MLRMYGMMLHNVLHDVTYVLHDGAHVWHDVT